MAPLTQPLTLFEMAMGNTLSQAIGLAAGLGLADELHRRPMTRDDLATAVGFDADGLARLLLLLTLIGAVRCRDGRFHLTEFGQPLRSDATPSLNGWARLASSVGFGRSLGHLESALATSVSGYQTEYGDDVFTYLDRPDRRDERARYDAAMGGVIGQEAAEVAAAIDLSSGQWLVDVGGGDGSLCVALAQHHRSASFTVFDAGTHSTSERLAGRVQQLQGDFFQSVPPGADRYLLCRILHDWTDGDATRILTRCRQAMAADAQLLIVEQLTDRAERPFTALCDLNMAVFYGSAERTTAEYEDLLHATGFVLRSVTPLSSGRFVLRSTISTERNLR